MDRRELEVRGWRGGGPHHGSRRGLPARSQGHSRIRHARRHPARPRRRFRALPISVLVAGVVLGAIFGALPGLTATMGVAVLTPLTFWISAEQGLAMLLGIYCAAIPAGGIPAILINVPGTPASIATSWDGTRSPNKARPGWRWVSMH
ncbi:MAG: tripartite tricarboxylate transporter permease [Bryobacterales bacterium]